MSAPDSYEPLYIELQSVPIEVADRYSIEDKREALFQAETELEIDRNGGEPFADEDITNVHKQAVMNLATYYLVRGATSNDDVTLGDLDDGGEQTERHADQYKETYESLVEKLAEAGPGGQSGTYFGAEGDAADSTAVNKGRRHNLTTDSKDLVHGRFVNE